MITPPTPTTPNSTTTGQGRRLLAKLHLLQARLLLERHATDIREGRIAKGTKRDGGELKNVK